LAEVVKIIEMLTAYCSTAVLQLQTDTPDK